MHRVALALAGLLCALAVGCSGNGDKSPAATIFPELPGTPGPTAIPPPLPTPVTEIPSTTWLIDVDAGRIITLFEDTQHSLLEAVFDDETSSVLYQTFDGTIRKDFDGNQIAVYEDQGPSGVLAGSDPWESTQQGCKYKGRLYEGTNCGPVSPDGRWMTYHLNTRDLEPTGSEYDLWAVDLDTGATRELLHGLYQCTQCDVGAAIHWSASGRYLQTGNAGGESAIFLVDVETAVSRDITVPHPTPLGTGPHWSPATDVLIRPTAEGTTILEDLQNGTETELKHLPWPARFDPSGAYLYTVPEISGPPPRPKIETFIANASTGKVIATLPGVGGYNITEDGLRYRPIPPDPVLGTAAGFVAALVGAPDCQGTSIYQNATPVTCVPGAFAPVFSPDGSRVVLARKTGETGPVRSPTIESVGLDIYDLIAVDVATGQERGLAQGAIGSSVPPQVVWNAAGTHLLVRWPYHYGP